MMMWWWILIPVVLVLGEERKSNGYSGQPVRQRRDKQRRI